MSPDQGVALGVIVVSALTLACCIVVSVSHKLDAGLADTLARQSVYDETMIGVAEAKLRADVFDCFAQRRAVSLVVPPWMPERRAKYVILSAVCEARGSTGDAEFWALAAETLPFDARSGEPC